MKKTLLSLLIIHFSLLIANAQWVMVHDYGPARGFTDNGNILYAAVSGYGILKTTNSGDNWVLYSNGILGKPYNTISTKDSFVFVASNQGLYKSTNYGENFDSVTSVNYTVRTLIISNNYIFTGSLSGIRRSSDWGSSWDTLKNGLPINYPDVRSLAYWNTVLYAGIQTPLSINIYKSLDTGNNWFITFPNLSGIPYNLYTENNLVLCGAAHGVHLSSNSGDNWRLINEIPQGIWLYGFASSEEKNIFVCSYNFGFYVSNDYGQTWTQRNEGLSNLATTALYKYGNYLFIGTNPSYGPGGIYRRTLNEVIGVNNISTEVPNKHKLYQNYPNPFNSRTIIRFEIPELSSPHVLSGDLVSIKVFDISGKEIATLVNEKQSPGTYEVSFDGSNLSSGIYFYRLSEGGKNIQTRKMILLK